MALPLRRSISINGGLRVLPVPRRRRPYLLVFLCARRKLFSLFALQSRLLPRLFLCTGQGRRRPACKLFPPAVHARDRDRILPPSRSGESLAKSLSGLSANLKPALGFEDLDGADVAFGDAAGLTNQREKPSRLRAWLRSRLSNTSHTSSLKTNGWIDEVIPSR
jgi:hypothetical protein